MRNLTHLLPFPIAELQRRTGRKSYTWVYLYITGKVICPKKAALAIEAATNGAVLRGDLRPDLWPEKSHSATPTAS
jgi:hypothetical protein